MDAFTKYAPSVGVCVGISTIVTCMIVSQSLDHETGGLTWPYISDTGRDNPEYYIFAVGMLFLSVDKKCCVA